MTSASEPETLVLTRTYPQRVEEVWAALTESERLGRWLGTFTGAGGPAGTVELTVTGEVDAGGEVADPATVRILECLAPHRLVVEVDGSWRQAVSLAADGDGTSLRFEQPVPEGMSRADLEAGWAWYLDRLGAALADAPASAWPDWQDYAPQ